MHMRNVGHGSDGPKSLATDHTDRRSLPRIARTEALLPRITPITRTEQSLSQTRGRSIPGPWLSVSSVGCCHGSHGPKMFATGRTDRSPVATDHTDHMDRTVSLSHPWPIDPRPWLSVSSVGCCPGYTDRRCF